ncbi:ion transporter [Chloroflexota bacterium]
MQDNERSYETRGGGGTLPGDRVIHIKRSRHRRKLRVVPNIPGILRFFLDIIHETPLLPLLLVLTALWLLSSLGLFLAERLVNEQFHSYGNALWWTFTAMQTQGANSPGPITTWGILIGATWSIIGTIIFFGVIIATVYAYYMVPRNRRHAQVIIDAIEYNLNEIDHLSVDELNTLKDTVANIVNKQISNIDKSSQNKSSK